MASLHSFTLTCDKLSFRDVLIGGLLPSGAANIRGKGTATPHCINGNELPIVVEVALPEEVVFHSRRQSRKGKEIMHSTTGNEGLAVKSKPKYFRKPKACVEGIRKVVDVPTPSLPKR